VPKAATEPAVKSRPVAVKKGAKARKSERVS
jgi:hypothetical protein